MIEIVWPHPELGDITETACPAHEIEIVTALQGLLPKIHCGADMTNTTGVHRFMCSVGIDIDAATPVDAAAQMRAWLDTATPAIHIQQVDGDREPVGPPLIISGESAATS